MNLSRERTHVSLLALPEAMPGSIAGLYDVFRCFGALGWFDPTLASHPPFEVDVVGGDASAFALGALTLEGRRLDEVTRTDYIIVPSVMVEGGVWRKGRYPQIVSWLKELHEAGTILCSACSGSLLIAETGLLDGREATAHWAYAETFRRNFPSVHLRLEQSLVIAGQNGQFIMSGAATSWHDLALYLIARTVGPSAAQAVAKFYAFQWHLEGLAPYVVFEPCVDHGDAAVLHVQKWLAKHLAAPNPVEEMVRRSGLPERTFKRRFRNATRLAPITYVQCLRMERAKQKLETTSNSIEEIGWAVGYEDTSSFRRLFRRRVGMSPGAYRRKFRLPAFARAHVSEIEAP